MKKREIHITIPDRLTDKEELQAIGKALNQKILSGSSKQEDKKRIGDCVEVDYLETTIKITRVGAKPIELITCNVCGCDYQNDDFKKVFTNYGGKVKMIKVCSDACQEQLIDMCGEGRAATSKSKLKPLRRF